MSESSTLQVMYENRFSEESQQRHDLWAVIAQYLQQWIDPRSVVLEVAAGRCEFINNVRAASKIAVDLNPGMTALADDDVETHVCSSTHMVSVKDDSVDVVFVSNFFEHISKDDILKTLAEMRRVLRPGGRLIILQPNIRYCARDYWMFFDHVTALDDRSLQEALTLTGYEIEHKVARFLPYTTKRWLPSAPLLVKLYLRCRPAWLVLGAQALFVVRTPE